MKLNFNVDNIHLSVGYNKANFGMIRVRLACGRFIIRKNTY